MDRLLKQGFHIADRDGIPSDFRRSANLLRAFLHTPFQGAVEIRQFLGHVVEGLRKHADFVPALDLCAGVQIPGSKALSQVPQDGKRPDGATRGEWDHKADD